MSTSSAPSPSTPAKVQEPPFFGALLRVTWRQVRDEMLRAVHAAGFSDFQDAHFAVFSYPLPDGARPSDMARQRQMSRQAINYLVAQLEELGYVERRVPEAGERRLIYLSARGWQVAETIFACLRRLQADWAEEIGQDRFEIFLGVLGELAARAEKAKETE
jgi:DNA-binding MarR family transcriptional regulator